MLYLGGANLDLCFITPCSQSGRYRGLPPSLGSIDEWRCTRLIAGWCSVLAGLNPRPGVARWTPQRPCSFYDVNHRSTRLLRPCCDAQRPHTSSSRFCRRGALVGAAGAAAVIFARRRDPGEPPHRQWTSLCRRLGEFMGPFPSLSLSPCVGGGGASYRPLSRSVGVISRGVGV